MAKSFHNRILRVDLTEGRTEIEAADDVYFRRYMGGWNIIADVLLREVPPGADPLGPENKLIFAPCVLTGLPVAGASRNGVGAKSPLTGGFGAGEVGGNWGAQFKRAGFDVLIVEGVSPKPVYLWISDGEVEIRDASHLWGKATKETQDTIREELGNKRIELAMIGPGGESLVRFSCVMNGLYDAAGRTGMGAVMGSKNLKAVASFGTQRLDGVDGDEVREIARQISDTIEGSDRGRGLSTYGTGVDLDGSVLAGNLPVCNFRDGIFPGAGNLSAENFLDEIGTGMEGCFACAVRCKKVVEAAAPYELDPDYGGPEYESCAALGSCCGVDDIVTVSKATELCNAHSLDTIGCGTTIAFAMECFENGLLTLEDTGGIDLRFGNGEAMVEMVNLIARREGLGDLLAEGVKRMAEKIGQDSAQYAMHVKGQEYPMHEPRYKRGLAIGYAVSPTGADHNHSYHHPAAFEEDVLRRLGVLEPMDPQSLGPDKVRAFTYININKVARNCLSVCAFVPWSLDQWMQILRAATGWNVTDYEYMKVGERGLTLARIYNIREGLGPEDDKLPSRSYGPTTDGALANSGIDAEELNEAVHTYYGMMGWNRETGVPTREKLWELDLGWAEEHLPG